MARLDSPIAETSDDVRGTFISLAFLTLESTGEREIGVSERRSTNF